MPNNEQTTSATCANCGKPIQETKGRWVHATSYNFRCDGRNSTYGLDDIDIATPVPDEVLVPVEKLKSWAHSVAWGGLKYVADGIRSYIPTPPPPPEPRLVTVDLDELKAIREQIATGKPAWSELDDIIERLEKD